VIAFFNVLYVGWFMFCWVSYKRGSYTIAISDIFFAAFLAIVLPFFFFNPEAKYPLHKLELGSIVVEAGQRAIACVLIVGGGCLLVRRRWGSSPRVSRIQLDHNAYRSLGLAASTAALISLSLFLIPELLDFRLQTLRWLTGELNGSEYIGFRRFYSGGVYDAILGRMRFVVLPIIYLGILASIAHRKNWLLLLLVAPLFFVALPASFSKLPVIYYIGYTLLFICFSGQREPKLSSAILVASAGVVAAIMIMSALYVLQYGRANEFVLASMAPVNLAFERIWGESYSIILRYLAVYPEKLPFTGISGISLLARLWGVEPRIPDLEVTRVLLGLDSGSSNPGMFFLGGYAAFGNGGLAAFAALGFLAVWAVDEIGNMLRTDLAYRIYFSIMALNCLFLLQVALQTTFLTYGVAIIPVLVLILDRWLAYAHQRRIHFSGTTRALEIK
jgi:hypothetical protein